MAIQLLTAEDYKRAPENPGEKFAYLEGICRVRVYAALENAQSQQLDMMLARDYMATVRAAAEALGVVGLPKPNNSDGYQAQFEDFQIAVSGIVTKIQIAATEVNPSSVRLSAQARKEIERKISLLRLTIEEAELPERVRAALLKKLEELSLELAERRFGFAKAMLVLSSVLALTTQSLADAPGALNTIRSAVASIMGLVGDDKEAEDEESRRLGAPSRPHALTDQRPPADREADRADLDDDEVPF